MDNYPAWKAAREADAERLAKWGSFLWVIALLFAIVAVLTALLAIGADDTTRLTVIATVGVGGAVMIAVLLLMVQSEKRHMEQLLIAERHHRERSGI